MTSRKPSPDRVPHQQEALVTEEGTVHGCTVAV
ncbi:hypothetical protein ABIE67_004358 [Streptomyces sp. V4I8]